MGSSLKKSHHPHVRGEEGFTLIETILALSILVVMLGLVISSLRLGYRSWEKGEGAVDGAASRRFIAMRFSEDAGSMYLYVQKNDVGASYPFSGLEHELGFVTVHRTGMTGAPWGGARYVLYTAGEGGLTVTEKTVPFSYERKHREEKPFVLEAEVKSVSFEYMGEDGWVKRWDVMAGKRLPAAVRARFSFNNDGRPLVVTVPVGVVNSSFVPAGTDGSGA